MTRFLKRRSRGRQVATARDQSNQVDSTPSDAVSRTRLTANHHVALRHHASVWLLPAVLLMLALLPWPYGYYIFLRLIVCPVAGWIAYTQWRHDQAFSGWVVALAAMATLYNPVVSISLTREIWSVLNVLSAVVFYSHYVVVRRMTKDGLRTSDVL